MRTKIVSALVFIVIFFGFSTHKKAEAAVKKPAIPSSVSVTYSLPKNRRALNVYFKNLNLAKSVSYTLSYTSNGETRGVIGAIDTKKKYSLSRQFLFGTCSNKVCRYDRNIKNCVLEVVTFLKNGKSVTKKYKIKV